MNTLFEPSLVVLATAFALDLALGEPPDRAHPVVWMGRVVSALERAAPRSGNGAELVYGGFVAFLVPLGFAFAAALLLGALEPWPWVGFGAAAFLLKTSFAVRALGDAAAVVREALGRGDLAGARTGLRSLCSRDPSGLDEPALAAATVESVAENASDSFVAPVFYYVLFGLPGAVFYRAVNTLDAMIGYHGRTEYLGKVSARLDDVLNWLPARLTAILLLAAGASRRLDVGRGLRILRRDGGKTESPNAGRPMAAMAGLLGVRLEKGGAYRLGDALLPIEAGHIDDAWSVVARAAALAMLGAVAAIGVRP